MEVIGKYLSLNYELVLPAHYINTGDTKWPLIVFLHGSGRRGNDISMLDAYGLNHLAKNDKSFKFLLLTPQCPLDMSWSDHKENVLALVEEVTNHFNIDLFRIYLAGCSLGGNGTWEIAAHSPQTFAAIA